MNTREIAEEYRLSHWAKIVKERGESGLSIKQYCENIGIHENSYYYWLKKLREAVSEEFTSTAGCITREATNIVALKTPIFAEVKLPELQPSATSIPCNQISIEAIGVRITAGGEYPIDKLTELLRTMSRTC